tara:strand:- start:692 stop:829 length:138 start_codon:yes stop_codon:yes gene_type:complete
VVKKGVCVDKSEKCKKSSPEVKLERIFTTKVRINEQPYILNISDN